LQTELKILKGQFSPLPLVCISLLFIVCISLPVLAADNQTRGASQPQKPPNGSKDREFVGQPFTQLPQLPEFPSYTGKWKFIRGIAYNDATGGPCYVMNFTVQDRDPQESRDWFKMALESCGWKVSATATSLNGISKGGNFLSLTVQPGRKGEDKSIVRVTYRFSRPS